MLLAVLVYAPQAVADTDGQGSDRFARWVEQFWPEARRAGVSRATFDAAFSGVRPNARIVQSEGDQPEFVRPIWDYLDRAVSNLRIRQGKAKLARHNARLREIQARYDVGRHYFVAIWGMETSYGANMGSESVIRSLATLAYEGRRSDFGRQQLLAALKILENGDVTPARMVGSWAGAMGHTQFIPTTYEEHAVDFTGDGQRDIWRSMSDALASTASYLSASGWNPDVRWGFEVRLPDGFDFSVTGLETKKITAEWVALGVERMDGRAFSQWAEEGSVIVPAGSSGPAFIVFGNFRSVMRYNNSISYALAVCHLADRLRGRPAIVQDWPRSDSPLSSSQKMELQRLLASRGFAIGEIDGRIGPLTQAALRAYQQRAGLVPDGYPSTRVLDHLRRDG
jgi:membrane-bound lytic murein transglycosylase B